MKRILCSLLIAVMLCSLMTGCDIEIPKNTENPISSDMPSNKPLPTLTHPVEISDLDKDEVKKLLKEQDIDIDKFTFSPTEDNTYPIDLRYNGDVVTVYVDKKTGEKYIALVEGLYSSEFNSYKSAQSVNTTSAVFDMATVSENSGAVNDVAELAVSMPMPYMPEVDFNTSEYNEVDESSYLSTKTSPLSTFAADVDTASYTNLRKILKDIYLLDTKDLNDLEMYGYEYDYSSDSFHDVRIEEMVNYFDYSYGEEGKESDKFTISAEIGTTPWNPESKLLVVNVKAKELPAEEYKGSNLVFLIDTSGSMDEPDKLPLLKESLYLLIERLTEKDTVSIVTYSGDSAVLADGLTGRDKEKLTKIVEELTPYGSTNGEGGIKAAYDIAEKYKDTHSNSRIIMCSDGDLNVGISSESELTDLVEEKRETGIYLSVLGFGVGNYKDNKMETLADNGNGNYYYIDGIKEGQKVLVEDIMSTLVTLADDVKFQLEFNPEYVKGYRKIGYENRDMANEDFADDTKDGGEVGYGHEVTVVYELVPVDSAIEINESDLKYQSSNSSGSTDWLTVNIRYKDHGEDTSKLIEYVVDESHVKSENSDDWKFISDVVGLGLILNESKYSNGLKIEDVINSLNGLDLSNDTYKTEFKSLVYMYDELN